MAITIDATTLSAALNATDNTLTVASATGFAAGNLLFVDREAMNVRSSYDGTSTTVPVTRGVAGTVAASHASGAAALCGPPREFYTNDPSGTGVAADEYALPHVNTKTGNVFQIAGGQWVRLRLGGIGNQGNAQEYDYTAAGAIAIAPGLHKVNGTTLAMTLANPAPIDNGTLLTVTDQNGSAHTLTVTGGFGGGGTGEDVATFSGVAGDSITVLAQDSLWHIVGAHQVTVA